MNEKDTPEEIRDRWGELPKRLAGELREARARRYAPAPGRSADGGRVRSGAAATENLLRSAGKFVPPLSELAALMANLREMHSVWRELAQKQPAATKSVPEAGKPLGKAASPAGNRRRHQAKPPRGRAAATENLLRSAGKFVPPLGELAALMANLREMRQSIHEFRDAWKHSAGAGAGAGAALRQPRPPRRQRETETQVPRGQWPTEPKEPAPPAEPLTRPTPAGTTAYDLLPDGREARAPTGQSPSGDTPAPARRSGSFPAEDWRPPALERPDEPPRPEPLALQARDWRPLPVEPIHPDDWRPRWPKPAPSWNPGKPEISLAHEGETPRPSNTEPLRNVPEGWGNYPKLFPSSQREGWRDLGGGVSHDKDKAVELLQAIKEALDDLVNQGRERDTGQLPPAEQAPAPHHLSHVDTSARHGYPGKKGSSFFEKVDKAIDFGRELGHVLTILTRLPK